MHDAVLLNNSPLLPCMYSTRCVCAKYKCQWGYGIISIKDLLDSHKWFNLLKKTLVSWSMMYEVLGSLEKSSMLTALVYNLGWFIRPIKSTYYSKSL